VEVRHDEGIANRIGPEPCAVPRKEDGEASVVPGRTGAESKLAAARAPAPVPWPASRPAAADHSSQLNVQPMMALHVSTMRPLHFSEK
jgi:hypothetical protein